MQHQGKNSSGTPRAEPRLLSEKQVLCAKQDRLLLTLPLTLQFTQDPPRHYFNCQAIWHCKLSMVTPQSVIIWNPCILLTFLYTYEKWYLYLCCSFQFHGNKNKVRGQLYKFQTEVKVCFVADFILKMLLTGWRHLTMSIKKKTSSSSLFFYTCM